MMNRTDVHVFVRRNPSVVIVSIALALVATMAAVETSGILPLEGQATPMYGALPVSSIRARSSSSRKPSLTEQRKAERAKQSSAASMRAAAPASSSSSARWTDSECTQSVHPDAACTAKMKAVLEGDIACFMDRNCYTKVWMCKLTREECRQLTVRRWAYDAFFPGCTTAECIDGAAFLSSGSSPVAFQLCSDSYVCRELLASFRRGDFSCRQHAACLDTLTVLLKHPTCDTMPWCVAMKTIDRLYTEGAATCTTGPDAACRTKLNIDAVASTVDRRIICRYDSGQCYDDMNDVADTLGGRNRGGSRNKPDAGCFLIPECKSTFEATKNWACFTVKREPDCTHYTNIWKLLTETKKSCVTSAETKTCQDAIGKLIR